MRRVIVICCLSLIVLLLFASCATHAPKACPACGSSNWAKVTEKNNGYNYGKGVVGRKIFGPLGWFAGSFGNTEDVYYCYDCGFSCSYK